MLINEIFSLHSTSTRNTSSIDLFKTILLDYLSSQTINNIRLLLIIFLFNLFYPNLRFLTNKLYAIHVSPFVKKLKKLERYVLYYTGKTFIDTHLDNIFSVYGRPKDKVKFSLFSDEGYLSGPFIGIISPVPSDKFDLLDTDGKIGNYTYHSKLSYEPLYGIHLPEYLYFSGQIDRTLTIGETYTKMHLELDELLYANDNRFLSFMPKDIQETVSKIRSLSLDPYGSPPLIKHAPSYLIVGESNGEINFARYIQRSLLRKHRSECSYMSVDLTNSACTFDWITLDGTSNDISINLYADLTGYIFNYCGIPLLNYCLPDKYIYRDFDIYQNLWLDETDFYFAQQISWHSLKRDSSQTVYARFPINKEINRRYKLYRSKYLANSNSIVVVTNNLEEILKHFSVNEFTQIFVLKNTDSYQLNNIVNLIKTSKYYQTNHQYQLKIDDYVQSFIEYEKPLDQVLKELVNL
jgi:hypothetical protein